MPDTYTWEPAFVLSDEHRLFPLQGDPFKQVAIADNSGREPQDTDDGVLCIPVKRDDGERFSTVTNMSTMLYLSATFDWPIEDQLDNNTVYTVKEGQ